MQKVTARRWNSSLWLSLSPDINQLDYLLWLCLPRDSNVNINKINQRRNTFNTSAVKRKPYFHNIFLTVKVLFGNVSHWKLTTTFKCKTNLALITACCNFPLEILKSVHFDAVYLLTLSNPSVNSSFSIYNQFVNKVLYRDRLIIAISKPLFFPFLLSAYSILHFRI